ncbi:MAG: hypothetical protein CVU87_11690 [Firmicutes bacterium HGW-Firmicutes-12]|jgi:hypothetical protein|nr:MAG: hypothetical protein CVU87_11690 [Firmicutes bacterium HGW-Firmicutes-12]
MSLEYAIIGGYLEIDKGVFAKEMLRRNSRLLKLLGSGDLAQKPIIKKNETNKSCIVDYTHSAEIKLEETYPELFKGLIKDYPGKIKGKVTIRVNSPYNTFVTEYSINSHSI